MSFNGYIWIKRDGHLYDRLEAIEKSNLKIAESNMAIAEAINNFAEIFGNKDFTVNNYIGRRRRK